MNVRQRISIQQEHIATLADFERTRFILHSQSPGGDNCRCLQRFQRSEAGLDVELDFTME